MTDVKKEIAEAIRVICSNGPGRESVKYEDLLALADRLSSMETWPKWFVRPDFPCVPDDTSTAYVKFGNVSNSVLTMVNGRIGESVDYGFFVAMWPEVTEAEAKARVRPEPPKGTKLTGEFRVPSFGEWWCHATGVGGIGTDLDRNLNGGKRWILGDDITCPRCKGTGKV